MKFRRESTLACTPEQAWELVCTSGLLERVCHPLLAFKGHTPDEIPDRWPDRTTVVVRMYLFGFLPLGKHQLYIESINHEERTIQTRERDAIINRWDHLIQITATANGETRYSDELEIDAGILTLPVVLFAKFFYAHRQRHWKQIAREI